MLFNYKALTKEGQPKEGAIDALNKDVAVNSLHERGLTILSLADVEQASFFKRRIRFFDHIPTRDIVVLSRQLATLFLAQVSALRVFRMLAVETENELLRSKLNEVADDIQGGSSISVALDKHPTAFSSFYVSMVRVGEESGKLNDIFAKLADHLDRSYELTLKTRNALIYPAFVVTTFIAVMVLMLTLVFPRLAAILTETGQEVPFYTKVVIAISDFLVDYGLFFLILIILGVVALWQFSKKNIGKMYLSHVQLDVPFFKNLLRKFYLSRIADTMHIMLSSGVSIVRVLEITANTVGNAVYEQILKKAAEDVRGGSSVSEAFGGYKEMPGIVVQIIKVGEETGELSSILETLSKFYRREVNNAVDVLVGLIEPALIILLAVGVGLILSSVLIPVYNLASGF